MYDVIVRKSVRHDDGRVDLYEEPWKVNAERHAMNLAAKIAHRHGIQWVEVEEITGLFKARASLRVDGVVHGSLESKRPTSKTKKTPKSNPQRKA